MLRVAKRIFSSPIDGMRVRLEVPVKIRRETRVDFADLGLGSASFEPEPIER